MDMEIISIPAIAATVGGVMQLLKRTLSNETLNRLIPLLSLLLGALIGIGLFYAYPEVIPADNAAVALLIGAASGWAATGAHQTGKQLEKLS